MMRWAAENPSAARQILKRDREVTTNRRSAQRVSAAPLILAAFFAAERMSAQAQNMDGQSGGFFQPWANVVPSGHRQFGGPTVVFHIVGAGPIAGNYMNVGVEEGFGNWLELGFTRTNYADGGNLAISLLFNFAG
jgi:hypothetical protein